jgi:hypothetical protein
LADYYEGPRPRCLRTGQIVADKATLIVISALADFPVIANKLIPFCGFEGVAPRVFLRRPLSSSEITGEQVIIVAERGFSEQDRLNDIPWTWSAGLANLSSLATELVSDATNKLRLFASEETEGWQCVIGDNNWSTADE